MAETAKDCVSDRAELTGRHRGWSAFNRWRKKYWLGRVLVLLVMFGPAMGPWLARRELLTELVSIAVDSILKAREPAHAWHLARYHRVEEAERLRDLLRRELDTDGDGTVSDVECRPAEEHGLAPGQLDAKVLDLDLAQLTGVAGGLDLVPAGYTAESVRRRCWDAAAAESEQFFEPRHRIIEAHLTATYGWPDYGRWETWRRGLGRFCSRLTAVLIGPGVVIGWLPVTFLLGGIAALCVHGRRATAGMLLGVALAVALLACMGTQGRVPPWGWMGWLGWGLLFGIAGLLGGRTVQGVGRRLLVASCGMLLAGASMVAGGTLGLLYLLLLRSQIAIRYGTPDTELLRGIEPAGAAILGAVLLVAGIIGLATHCRRRELPDSHAGMAKPLPR